MSNKNKAFDAVVYRLKALQTEDVDPFCFYYLKDQEQEIINELNNLHVVCVGDKIKPTLLYRFGGIKLTVDKLALDVLETARRKNKPKSQYKNKRLLIRTNMSTPYRFNLFEDHIGAYLIYKGRVIKIFKQTTSSTYKMFRYLWINSRKKIDYEELYRSKTKAPYPTKHTVCNKNMARSIRRLGKDLSNTPIIFMFNEGIVLDFREGLN